MQQWENHVAHSVGEGAETPSVEHLLGPEDQPLEGLGGEGQGTGANLLCQIQPQIETFPSGFESVPVFVKSVLLARSVCACLPLDSGRGSLF